MMPSKQQFPRAAGFFGRISGLPRRAPTNPDIRPSIADPDSYRTALLRKAVAFTIGKRNEADSGARPTPISRK
jgi:hypothetical protein